jgi:hypothetical protein
MKTKLETLKNVKFSYPELYDEEYRKEYDKENQDLIKLKAIKWIRKFRENPIIDKEYNLTLKNRYGNPEDWIRNFFCIKENEI